MINFLKKYLKEIILIGSICLVSLILILIFKGKSEDVTATIYLKTDEGTKILEVIDLSKVTNSYEKEIVINGKTVKLEIKHNAIRVIDAPCKHKDCINSGWTSNKNKPIICLDLGYTIVISRTDDTDVVV